MGRRRGKDLIGMCSERAAWPSSQPSRVAASRAAASRRSTAGGRSCARTTSATSSAAGGLSATHVSAAGTPVREDSPTTATARPSTMGVWARSSSSAALEHARLDAGRAAEGEHRVVVARVRLARVKEQRGVVELRERHGRARSERVVAAQQHALALVADHLGLEPVARGRAAHEPGVERPFAHRVEDVPRRP